MVRTFKPFRRCCRQLPGLLCMALFGIGGTVAAADPVQDPQLRSGAQLARIACSGCHLVAPDPEAPSPLRNSGPRFVDIANRPGVSEKSLQRFISTTHWDGESMPMKMPKPELTAQQVAALARYIMSLRQR